MGSARVACLFTIILAKILHTRTPSGLRNTLPMVLMATLGPQQCYQHKSFTLSLLLSILEPASEKRQNTVAF